MPSRFPSANSRPDMPPRAHSCAARRSSLLLGLLASLVFYACAQGSAPGAPTLAITLWFPPTPTATLPFPAVTPQIPVTPTPSPTPVTYQVAGGDTLSSIAGHFGVSVQALGTANPGILPQFLRIGQQLLIPVQTGPAAAAPTPTPMPLQVSSGRCYPAATGATWCLADVHNPGPLPVEGVALLFTLYDQANQALAQQVESLPLGLLPAGGSLPAAAFFSPSEHPGLRAMVTLVEDVASQNSQQRYLPVELVGSESSLLQGGLELNGQARLSAAAAASAAHVTVLLVLYDSTGNSVGLRLLELDETWAPGQVHPFTLRAYPLAGAFSHYAVFLEARP